MVLSGAKKTFMLHQESAARSAGLKVATPIYLKNRIDALGGLPGVSSKTVAKTFKQVFDAKSSVHGVLGFSTRFTELMKDEQTSRYLQQVVQGTQRGQNLWDLTLQFTGGNRDKAVELLGVLFQDTTLHGGHLDWESHQKNLTDRQKMNVVYLVRAIQQVRTLDAAHVYPADSGVDFAPGHAYHFWTMAHAAAELQRRVPNADARVAPFLFNLFYEYVSDRGLLPETRTLRQGITFAQAGRWLGKITRPVDPPSIDAEKFRGSLQDIYLGLAGSNFGVGQPSDSFEQVAPRLAADPRGFIQAEFFPGSARVS